jgi:hypothetical protein
MQEISDFPATEMQEITEMCFTSRDTPWCIISSNIAAGRELSSFRDLPNPRCQLHRDSKPIRLHSSVRAHSCLERFSRETQSVLANAAFLVENLLFG